MNAIAAARRPTRDVSIESLRALAIALVIGFHIRRDPSVGDAIPTYDWLAYTFRNIRIPLFTTISGYLYAVRPVAAGGFRDFMTGKLRRLLVPLLVVSTLEYVFRAFGPGSETAPPIRDIWRIYVFPYTHYWFLQAVLLVMLLVGFLETRGLLARFEQWVLAILIAFLALKLSPFKEGAFEPLSLGGFLALTPFFLLGLGIQRFRERMLAPSTVAVASIVFLVTLAVLQWNWMEGDTRVDSTKTGIFGLLLGFTGCLLLFRFRPSSRFLAWVGGFSFTIYLFQAFGAGLDRLFLAIPGINPHLYFFALLAFTVGFGIAVDVIAARIPIARALLLGRK